MASTRIQRLSVYRPAAPLKAAPIRFKGLLRVKVLIVTPDTGHSTPQVCPGLEHSKVPEDVERCCWPVAVAEGYAFEMNNNVPHRVRNNSTEPRIHLIIDAGTVPHSYVPLAPGQVCKYEIPEIIC